MVNMSIPQSTGIRSRSGLPPAAVCRRRDRATASSTMGPTIRFQASTARFRGSSMTPQQFITKWKRATLSERSACQQHFLDLCELLGQPKPADVDSDGSWYTFERGVHKTSGGQGWADVWMRGHFGWEYKGKHKDLTAAYQQLLLYREDLENPPLLVVCDMDRFE